MPVFHDTFTSSLAMWSPSTLSSLSLYATAWNDVNERTKYYHEPVYYPAACIICGLSHHPTTTTNEKEQSIQPAVPTPWEIRSVERRSGKVEEKKSKSMVHHVQRLFCQVLVVINKPIKLSSSSSSEKSVRFSEENKTFYTHSPRDYDRSSVKQTCRLPASLGQTYLTVFEQILIENPLQDSIVKRNTSKNGMKSTKGRALKAKIAKSSQPRSLL
ncbi:hypothetical protein CU097_008653 [Rhizopus azygosporus]|uniref:Uncharacterized protein n=2 Tax=Rhizopus TaxID=4842 RepID=A0A367JM67_RHIAZ|nr:hypothetical protein BCV71DRAFT_287461 [Rhizopus microsporus]RCH90959.1 hypothetical protein CU097_008653 [Rhizopus azygosporus]